MKNRASHLQYDWWKYVAVLLLPLFLWGSVFSVLAKPKANERLHILVLGEGVNTGAMEQALSLHLQENTVQNIRSVKVSVANYEKATYHNRLLAAAYSYDLIIIGKAQMIDLVGQGYFAVLPEELQSDGITLYEEAVNGEMLPFGAVVFDKETDNTFGTFYTGKEACYLFISPQTVNLYPLNAKSGEGDQAAVIAWRWLMEKL